MSRPIDADKLRQYFIDKVKDFTYKTIHVDDVVACIDAMPTVEPKCGEWIAKTENYHSHWVCSKCGAWALLEYNEQMCLSNFCPNCGADMREREDE